MQIFERENIQMHCVGQEWPEFLGTVRLGESFVVETEQYNSANGPIAIQDVRAGDSIAVHVERGWRRVVNDPRAKHCHQDCQYLTEGQLSI